jgi:chromate transporter
LRLGCTSFGGPVAHLGFFRTEFVQRRQWLGERAYADLVALCQFLPGPASSQVGMALGLVRGGWGGALAAWAGFTLPSALLLTLLALGLSAQGNGLPPGVLQGLKLVAVAVVAQAVWGMARTLCRGPARLALMLASAVLLWRFGGVGPQLLAMLGAAVLGWWLWGRGGQAVAAEVEAPLILPFGPRGGALLLAGFALLLVLLPWLARAGQGWAVFDAFYRSGALVFGGGHVVLPLLQAEVVEPGWLGSEVFMAGYGLAQAVPGPLFTFAAFVGASLQGWPSGWAGAALCLVAIFLPAFLLVAGALPFWVRLRARPAAQAALAGVNAAVVGMLLAALLGPLGMGALHAWHDAALVLLAWAALQWARLPPWMVVLAGAALGGLLLR